MFYTAVIGSSRISGVAAVAGVDVSQPRAKANTTGSTGLSCETEHQRLARGGIGVKPGSTRRLYRVDSFQARAALTNRN